MGVVLIVLIGIVYFFPTVAAISNKKSNTTSIFIVNLFLGWSLIGWVVALAWAFSKDKEKDIVKVFMDTHGDELGYIRGGSKK